MPASVRLGDFLREQARRLEVSDNPDSLLNLEWLLSERLGIPRLELPLNPDRVLSGPILDQISHDVKRLLAGEPLQYVIGHVPFHGLSIRCDCRALIPRPETEWVVDQVLACPAIWASSRPVVVDAGTGTGCIALALAAAHPEARVMAVDVSAEALSLARENRDALGLADRVDLRQGDLLEGLPDGQFDAVVSNPPYIPSEVCRGLEAHVREHEPRLALDGGSDGLGVIRRLAAQAIRCLKPGRPLWLEIGFDQGESVPSLLSAAGFERVAVRHDDAGHPRAVCAWCP